MAAVFGAAS